VLWLLKLRRFKNRREFSWAKEKEVKLLLRVVSLRKWPQCSRDEVGNEGLPNRWKGPMLRSRHSKKR